MCFVLFFFLSLYCDHRDLHVLTHSFPTRCSSDLHTLTSVNQDTLLIYGGLGADQRSLHDIVILATDTMTWSRPSVSGIPPPALFSHAAAVVHSATGLPLLLVFGGSASNSEKVTHHSNKLYSCDLISYVPASCLLHLAL